MKVTIGKLTIEVNISWKKSYMSQIISALRGGYKLRAIKIYKDATGVSLIESKDYIESLCPKYLDKNKAIDWLVQFQAEQFNK